MTRRWVDPRDKRKLCNLISYATWPSSFAERGIEPQPHILPMSVEPVAAKMRVAAPSSRIQIHGP